jgi:hypothetical protein
MTLVNDRAPIWSVPAVFILIWSSGVIVARYGMPHAPPFKFLALRYALSIACSLMSPLACSPWAAHCGPLLGWRWRCGSPKYLRPPGNIRQVPFG